MAQKKKLGAKDIASFLKFIHIWNGESGKCAHDIRYSWMPEYSNPWELELQAVLGKAVQTLNPFIHDQSFSHSGMFKVLHQLKLP